MGDMLIIPTLLDLLTLDTPVRPPSVLAPACNHIALLLLGESSRPQIKRYLLAPRAKTQLAMDRLWIKQADIYLAFRMQLGSK